MAVKIEETKPEVIRKFVKGDLVQDIKFPQYIYLLGNVDTCGAFIYTSFTKYSNGVAGSAVSENRFNFNDGNHQLYKGRIILEND